MVCVLTVSKKRTLRQIAPADQDAPRSQMDSQAGHMSGDAQGLLDKCEVTVGEPVAESAAVASEAQLAAAQHVANIPPPPAAKL